MINRRGGLSLLVIAIACVGFLSPAVAEMTSVSDPEGDRPDILRLTLENRQSTVVLKQRFNSGTGSLEDVQVETLSIHWGTARHYRVKTRYEGDVLKSRLSLATSDGYVSKPCEIKLTRDFHSEVSIHKVPRSCIPQAENKLFAKGVAKVWTQGAYSIDRTKKTDTVSRG